jgi:uncharacterized membrane protein YqhA
VVVAPTDPTTDAATGPDEQLPDAPLVASVGRRVLEPARYLVAVGSITMLVAALACYVWALVKAGGFILALLPGGDSDDTALVKLFESLDVVLIGTVVLIVAVGLWELFIGDLRLPPALTMTSFDDLKAKIATTLILVLAVRFLEALVAGTEGSDLLELGAALTLVGGLLLVLANWRRR